MVEFRSKLEDIMVAEELRFNPTPSFGQYKPFLEQAIPHPAKMNTKLLKFLIEQFTKEGDTVLDPMCGSGSTGVVASLLNRNAVQVDIEKKFVDWAEQAKRKVEAQATLTTKGSIRNICGDSRKLTSLLKEADAVVNPENIGNLPHGEISTIITSPPYSEGIGHDSGDNASEQFKERLEMQRKYTRQMISKGNIGNLSHGNVDTIITSPPYAIDPKNVCHTKEGKTLEGYDKKRGFKPTAHPRIGYSPNEQNIGNLPLGEVDAVITSPPYGEAQDGHGIAKKGYQGKKHSPTDLVGNRSYMPNKFENEQNISRLKYDAVITSPPYAETYVGGGDSEKRKERLVKAGHNPKDFLGGKARNAVLKHYSEVDAVITSPPYGDSKKQPPKIDLEHEVSSMETNKRPDTKHRHTPGRVRGIKSLLIGYGEEEGNIGNLPFDAVITSPPYEGSLEGGSRHTGGICEREKAKEETMLAIGEGVKYSDSKDQIGNMKRETYLEAMLKVYKEMAKVLKPNGLAIIVIKPFIRNKQVVDLPYHTWLLLEKAGFKLVKLYKLRLKQHSFWRILYRKKYPRVPEIKHEYVLVTQKSLNEIQQSKS